MWICRSRSTSPTRTARRPPTRPTPRFAATVRIDFAGLPVATTASTGALDVAAGLWTGSVAEAEALILSLPGDYNGAILHAITVITPEGTESRLQTIITLPTPDIVIDGTVITAETDAPVEVLLSDFISVLVTDPNEAVEELSFSLPGLPPGTEARDADGNPVGTFTPAGDGTVGYALTLAASDPTDPAGIRLILPTDYSTENPATTLTAALTVDHHRRHRQRRHPRHRHRRRRCPGRRCHARADRDRRAGALHPGQQRAARRHRCRRIGKHHRRGRRLQRPAPRHPHLARWAAPASLTSRSPR